MATHFSPFFTVLTSTSVVLARFSRSHAISSRLLWALVYAVADHAVGDTCDVIPILWVLVVRSGSALGRFLAGMFHVGIVCGGSTFFFIGRSALSFPPADVCRGWFVGRGNLCDYFRVGTGDKRDGGQLPRHSLTCFTVSDICVGSNSQAAMIAVSLCARDKILALDVCVSDHRKAIPRNLVHSGRLRGLQRHVVVGHSGKMATLVCM